MMNLSDIELVRKLQVEMKKRDMEQPDWSRVGEVIDVDTMSEAMIDAYCQNLWKLGMEQRIWTELVNKFTTQD